MSYKTRLAAIINGKATKPRPPKTRKTQRTGK